MLDAEIVVETSFTVGRLKIYFRHRDLMDWVDSLKSLEKGRDTEWLDQGNGPVIEIKVSDEKNGDIDISVTDGSGSGVRVSIPLALDDDWIDRQRDLLNDVLKAWPSEVMETSAGTYTWRQ
ncbi:hypothetical protein EQG64_29800 [Streptomyces sp. S6]|nr:hypothetical protein EQG64_29800 [Streptomyces sp. S6]